MGYSPWGGKESDLTKLSFTLFWMKAVHMLCACAAILWYFGKHVSGVVWCCLLTWRGPNYSLEELMLKLKLQYLAT